MTLWEQPAGDVFVLGAGFSRAISRHLPLTDELGNACLELSDLRDERGVPIMGFVGGRFETWLSGLAEPQPYLSAPANLENQALFQRFSDAIATVLGNRVDQTLSDPIPPWLPRFLTATHCRRSTLITFNYDTLVECAVHARQLFQAGYAEPVPWTEVLGNVPAPPASSFKVGATPVDTLHLLKLHGSLNWYWVPGDASGISMARRSLPGTFEAPNSYQEVDRRRQLPGRVPFVVPPSATKSVYYGNAIVRETWAQAAQALRSAVSVSILGYSLPVTDATFSGMLRHSLESTLAPIQVVDVCPANVLARLEALGFDKARLTPVFQ